MMIGEMDIAQREAMIIVMIGVVMEGDHLVLIAEKGVVLIMVVGPVLTRGRGAALTMAMAAAVAEAPTAECELALLTGVEALVHIEERGMALILFVTPAAVLFTKSEVEPIGLPPLVPKEERGQALKMVVTLAVVLMIL